MRSLRTRALAAALLLVAVVVSATLLLSRQVVVSEFDAFMQRGQSRAADQLVAEVQAFVDRTGTLEGVGEILGRIHQRTQALLVLLRDGHAIAAAPTEPSTILYTSDGITITIASDGMHSEFTLAGPLPVIVGPGGEPLASLIALPAPQRGRGEVDVEVNRGLWWVAAGIGVAGVMLAGWAAGRLVRPLEQLTDAARRLAGGDLSQRVVVARTDEIGQLAGAFNSMAEGLERNEGLRRSLLNDVAHELRTPLTHVRAELEALQDGLRQPTPEVINRLHADARHLERLVDDLRDLAQAEAGQLRLTIEPVDLRAALHEAAASLESVARTRALRIEVTAGDVPEVLADRARFRQVLVNLLDNAVRHAPPGSAVQVAAEPLGEHQVRVSVSDEGPGVPEDALPRLFDRFFRADESRDRRTGGAGLGLAIVKQLVSLQRGTVEAVNLPRGFRVAITLPRPHKQFTIVG
ncbi:MAG: sensor histidine kinase [Vicinamibacterales bacterium]